MGLTRFNKQMEAAVTVGLAQGLLSGVLAGARTMRRERVPLHVALRVFLYPSLRRSTDWKR